MTTHRKIDHGGGWVTIEGVDPETGAVVNQYYYRKRLCGRVTLNSKYTQQLAGYQLVEKDLRNIRTWLDAMERLVVPAYPEGKQPREYHISPDRGTFDTVKGLFVASITLYGKLFGEAKGRRIRLERSWLDTDTLKKIHDDAIDLRHNFAAHSGLSGVESVAVALVVDPVRRRQTVPRLFCELRQPDTFGLEDITGLRSVVQCLHSKVEEKIKVLFNLIMQRDVIPKGMQHWYRSIKHVPNKSIESDK